MRPESKGSSNAIISQQLKRKLYQSIPSLNYSSKEGSTPTSIDKLKNGNGRLIRMPALKHRKAGYIRGFSTDFAVKNSTSLKIKPQDELKEGEN